VGAERVSCGGENSDDGYRVAVLGAGQQGMAHARAYRDIANMAVVALCDQDRRRLAAGLGVTGRDVRMAGTVVGTISAVRRVGDHALLTLSLDPVEEHWGRIAVYLWRPSPLQLSRSWGSEL